jgi:hypothetical protein
MTLRMRIDGKFKLRDVFQGVVVIGRRIRSGERTASERGARADLGKRCLLALKWVVIDTCHRSLTLLPICFPLLDFTKSSKLSPLPYSVCACELCSVTLRLISRHIFESGRLVMAGFTSSQARQERMRVRRPRRELRFYAPTCHQDGNLFIAESLGRQ